MNIRETRQVTEVVVVDVICNKCGKSCKDALGMNYECVNIYASWGFCSRKDTEVHKANLCEDCYDAMILDWIHPPEVS